MLQVIRYLQGYLTIKVWGFSPERFMNLCCNHNIFLWDIVNHGDYYTMNIRLRNFYCLKGFTRKTGTRVVITRRYGLPFLSVRAWKRKIFLLGLLGSLCFWIWMSGFVWAIEIDGNYFVTTDVFFDFLVENQIEVGMKKKDVDIEKLEAAIRSCFDIVTWTSVQIDGTRLLIQVKENDVIVMDGEEKKENDGEKEEAGMDLVADKDGVVVSIVTRSGVPKVIAGTEVKKDDILVEGGVPIYNDDSTIKRYDFCKADADVIIRCVYSIKEEVDERYEKKLYTGREKKIPFLIVGTRKLQVLLPGTRFERSDVVEEKKQLKVFENYYLPVYIGSNLVREYIFEEKKYTKEEVKSLFEQKLEKFIQTLQEKGVQIIEKNVTINKTSGVWKMKADFLAEEKTGTTRKTTLMQIEEAPVQEETE